MQPEQITPDLPHWLKQRLNVVRIIDNQFQLRSALLLNCKHTKCTEKENAIGISRYSVHVRFIYAMC